MDVEIYNSNDKGKTGENRRRKVTGLKRKAMTAEPPKRNG